MKKKDFMWYPAERDEVPALAFGVESARGRGATEAEALLGESKVAAAYSRATLPSRSYHPPSLFVLRASDAAETFSWLKVYSPEAFPLSQFARVVSSDEWNSIRQVDEVDTGNRPDRWGCVVLGEMLAQSEADTDLSSLPLSRAVACFSMAIGRTEMNFGRSEMLALCSDRLKNIEGDRRFVRRPISTVDLYPIWALTNVGVDDAFDVREAAEFAVTAARKYQMDAEPRATAGAIHLKDFPELFGDSVEERVRAFQRLSSALESNSKVAQARPAVAAATLAAAAFLVGRGTSHAFLLRKHPAIAPLAFVWFGLMAALGGARCWDPQWSRATKGVERQLRSAFSWEDPPASDLCWAEYFWLTNTFSGSQPFSDVSRLVAKTLSVEIVPGATCQLRMVASDTRTAEADQRAKMDSSVRENELRAALEQFLNLASRTRQILERGAAQPQTGVGSPQSALPFEKNSPSKTNRFRRGSKKDK